MRAPLFTLLLGLPTLLSGCDPWSRWPSGTDTSVDALWSSDIIAANGGVYVTLTHAGKLVFVPDSGAEATEVDLGGAEPVRATLAPDGESLLVTSRWILCDSDDDDIDEVSECPEDDQRVAYALDLVVGGERSASFDVPPYLNAFAFTHGGTTAVAYADEESYQTLDDLEGQAIVDLNAVAFIDLESRSAQTISVGFAPSNFLFSEDDSQALVLAQSQAVVVDLVELKKKVTYNLTLDDGEALDAKAADFTPDGRYALIAISGSKDLYKLDLEVESIDILSLDAVPSDLYVDVDQDKTAIVYAGKSKVDVLDHEIFAIEEVTLDAAATEIAHLPSAALLYNTSSDSVRYLYRLNLDDLEVTPYVVTNPVNEVLLSDSGAYALAVLRPSATYGGGDAEAYTASHWGLGVLDLTGDDALSVTLTGTPAGVVLSDTAETTYALVLQEGEDELLFIDLAQPSGDERLSLPAPPTGIGTMPDGRFWITHEAALGMISFLDPDTRELSTVSGFGALGLFTEDFLSDREEI